MAAMKLAADLLGHAWVYRLWQAPYAEEKFAPILAHNDLSRVRRVLDVGCGPGINTHHFGATEYLGIDYNPAYIEHARRRHRRNFLVADVTTFTAAPGDRFDFILVNSLLHHLDTPNARRLLSHLNTLLTDDGHTHIVELILPERPSIPRILARWDRGDFPRPVEEWQDLLNGIYHPVVFEPIVLTGLGAHLWEMFYFKGRAKR